jgi:hypothetical protein
MQMNSIQFNVLLSQGRKYRQNIYIGGHCQEQIRFLEFACDRLDCNTAKKAKKASRLTTMDEIRTGKNK